MSDDTPNDRVNYTNFFGSDPEKAHDPGPELDPNEAPAPIDDEPADDEILVVESETEETSVVEVPVMEVSVMEVPTEVVPLEEDSNVKMAVDELEDAVETVVEALEEVKKEAVEVQAALDEAEAETAEIEKTNEEALTEQFVFVDVDETAKLMLRTNPSRNSVVITKLPRETKLKVLEDYNSEWLMVETTEVPVVKGYVKKLYVTES